MAIAFREPGEDRLQQGTDASTLDRNIQSRGTLVLMSASTTSACPIARSLAVFGEKWSLLIIREANRGRTRFADFRSQLGVAPDVLTDRLTKLVGHGVLERRSYREAGERERSEYVLTPAGRALLPVLAALAAWGDTYCPTTSGADVQVLVAETGRPAELVFIDDHGQPVGLDGLLMRSVMTSRTQVGGPGSVTAGR